MKQLLAERAKKLFVISELQNEVAAINTIIAEQCMADMDSQFEQTGKTSGQITVNRDGVKILAERKKTVKWDNKKLNAIAAQMTDEQRGDYLKTTHKMDEKVFNQIPDGEFKDALIDARTVVIGETVIKAEMGE